MALEQRGGAVAYYRKERRGRRVISVYVGSGPAAALAATRAAQQRADAAQHRAAHRAAQQRASEARAADRALDQLAALAAALLLLSSNYHQHRRMWRRRRPLARRREDHPMQALSDQLLRRAAEQEVRRRAALAAVPTAGLPPALADLVRSCNRPDAPPADVAALRQQIAAHSDLLAQHLGGPLRQAVAAAVRQPVAPSAREIGAALADRRRAELGYDTAPALERGLIDHVVLCEVRLQTAERQHTSDPDPALDAAQRRYLRSVEALARVRRVTVAAARYTAPDGGRVEAVAVEGPGV